ncbi:hypothetical protein BDV93DRAFT_514947 [Ceratobasidium sp. AG-I]|nr:hypothetical protein BDV93DRAFT_514947 [Ceratobasidium sp. AG-I]
MHPNSLLATFKKPGAVSVNVVVRGKGPDLSGSSVELALITCTTRLSCQSVRPIWVLTEAWASDERLPFVLGSCPSINGLDHDPISTPSTSQLLPHPDKTDQLESTQIHSVGDQLCPILEMCTITGNIIGTESRSSFHGTQVGRQSDDSCDGEAFSRIPLNTTIPEIAMVVGHETDAAAHWFLNCDPVLDDIPLGLLETLVERLSSQSGGPLEPPFRDLQIRLFEIEGLLDVNAGQLLLDRATLVDSASDMERSIECLTRASQVIQGEDTDRLEVLEALTSAHETRFRRYGGIGDINSAIEYLNHMTVIAGHKYSDYQVMIAQLANLFALRYEVSEDLGDVQRAIENYSYALTHFSDGNEHRTNILSNLGTSYIFRFERLGEAGDLSRAIDCKNQAFHLTPEGHQDMPIRFSEMGNLYLHRFQHLGVMEDINRAIDHQTRAVQLTQIFVEQLTVKIEQCSLPQKGTQT